MGNTVLTLVVLPQWHQLSCATQKEQRNRVTLPVAAHWFTSVRKSRLMHFAAGGRDNNRLEQSQ
jgi:hypothetical protein